MKVRPLIDDYLPPLQQDFKANIWGNGASEVVNSGSKLVFTSEVVSSRPVMTRKLEIETF